jgi:hypothetical protein
MITSVWLYSDESVITRSWLPRPTYSTSRSTVVLARFVAGNAV